MRLIALIFSLFCFSCAADNDQTRPVEIESPETSGFAVARNAKARTSRMLDFQATESVQEQSIEQKQIKNANLVLKVNKLDGIEESVKTISAGLDSHITNTNTFATNFRRNMSLTIRVKADQFDQLLNKLEALAEYTESKNSSIRDVTEQFIDIEARLKNQKAAEQQYLQILKRATNVRDILNVQNQLQQIRGEIESQEGRLNYLSNQVDYSTITVNFFEILEHEIEPSSGFLGRILSSLISGWYTLLNSIFWLLSYWPFLILIGLIWFFRFRKTN